ncbi:HesB/YadR/YfhF family protein [Robertmurraya andreesenii]|uniref:Uncharacterized protein YneR n=1 Tax=Anoxybacillus andreesenii TaxID=1325932 RepID=A0ABT9V9E3_9BACL|nr:hypothetical protein [Robertmurraya andreesenii]MDQ0157571.1 uncharacterized protein YneR [Robertmurraya andreesenii]
MGLEVSQDAAKWYKEEMDLQDGDFVQFFMKLYGGIPTEHPNYFLGVSVGQEGTIDVQTTVEGITFYFNDKDSWFLDEYDMKIEEKNGDVEFVFNKK